MNMSDWWAVGQMGCWNSGLSDKWVVGEVSFVGEVGRRSNGSS